MSEIISVTGPECSGKTVLSIKLAQEIYEKKKSKKKVIVLSPDTKVPIMGYIFPNRKNNELFSLSDILNRTDIYREDVLRNTVTVKNMMNFGYIGFKMGENKFSFPKPTRNKVLELLARLREIADYVIVDTASGSMLSDIAVSESDAVVQIIKPDFKCMVYYASNAEKFSNTENTVKVMNITDSQMYLPKEEVARHFNNVKFTFPFSFEINKQAYTGGLQETVKDLKYKKVLDQLAKEVM